MSRFTFILLILLGIGFLLFLHYHLLLSNSRILAQESKTFSRDYYVGNEGDPQITYVALGDSTVEGTGVNSVAETLPYQVAQYIVAEHYYVHVLNFGFNGAKMHDVVVDQLPQLAKIKSDIITLNCGANDATHFTSTASFQADLQTVVQATVASAYQKVLIATAPDLSLAPALPFLYKQLVANRANSQNSTLKDMTNFNPKIKIIDLFSDGKLDQPALYASDEFHPSASGYALWAKLYDGADDLGSH